MGLAVENGDSVVSGYPSKNEFLACTTSNPNCAILKDTRGVSTGGGMYLFRQAPVLYSKATDQFMTRYWDSRKWEVHHKGRFAPTAETGRFTGDGIVSTHNPFSGKDITITFYKEGVDSKYCGNCTFKLLEGLDLKELYV